MKLSRYFRLTALSLVFGFFGVIVLSHVPKGITAPSDVEMGRVANVASFESTHSNAVEVDGIYFETLVPETVWTIPENQPGASTPVQLGIRITNPTQQPVRFSWSETVFPQLVTQDGKAIEMGLTRGMSLKIWESECPLILPGTSEKFFPASRLFWNKEKLILSVSDNHSAKSSGGLDPGAYQLRLLYRNDQPTLSVWSPTTGEEKTLQGIWVGQVTTPAIEIHLVQK